MKCPFEWSRLNESARKGLAGVESAGLEVVVFGSGEESSASIESATRRLHRRRLRRLGTDSGHRGAEGKSASRRLLQRRHRHRQSSGRSFDEGIRRFWGYGSPRAQENNGPSSRVSVSLSLSRFECYCF